MERNQWRDAPLSPSEILHFWLSNTYLSGRSLSNFFHNSLRSFLKFQLCKPSYSVLTVIISTRINHTLETTIPWNFPSKWILDYEMPIEVKLCHWVTKYNQFEGKHFTESTSICLDLHNAINRISIFLPLVVDNISLRKSTQREKKAIN